MMQIYECQLFIKQCCIWKLFPVFAVLAIPLSYLLYECSVGVFASNCLSYGWEIIILKSVIYGILRLELN